MRLAILIAMLLLSAGLGLNYWSTLSINPENSRDRTDTTTPPFDENVDPKTIIAELTSGRNTVTLRTYDSVLKRYPHDIDVRYHLTVTMLNLGRYQEAERVSRELSDLEPTKAVNWFLHSESLYWQAKFQEAYEARRKAKEVGTNDDHLMQDIEKRLVPMQQAFENPDFFDSFRMEDAEQLSSHEILAYAEKAEYLDKYDLAISLTLLAHYKLSDEASRTVLRHNLLYYFVTRQLHRPGATEDFRQRIYSLAISWLSQQLEFAQNNINASDPTRINDRQIMELVTAIQDEKLYLPIRKYFGGDEAPEELHVKYEAIMAEAKRLLGQFKR